MVTGKHIVIRNAEPDDAAALKRVYDPTCPRNFQLDRKRELLDPTLFELRELLARKDVMGVGAFFAFEDTTGLVRGFGILRGAGPENPFAEFLVAFMDDADYETPMAREAFDFFHATALIDRRLNKLMAACLECETAYRGYLLRCGFESNGVQREVVFTGGRWLDLETMTLRRSDP